MRKILATMIVGAVLALVTSVAVAESPTVYGTVTMKFNTSNVQSPLIAVDGTPYSVPYSFNASIRVGDKVQFDGSNWSIVK